MGFQISDFGFRISDFRFQISDFRFQISDFGFRISDFGFRIKKVKHLVSFSKIKNPKFHLLHILCNNNNLSVSSLSKI
ncbi:MAG: hypothetical protein DI548_14300 [Flavobacterium johnsoniae]|nr:MAG: hypothetical protein DI548_14300 [Flavobacterium johnsoniae]